MSVQPTQTLRCGDAWIFNGQCQNPDGSIPNLTGCTVIFKLDTLDFLTNVLTLTNGLGTSITSATGGQIQWGPTKTQTAAISPATYYYTVQVIFPDGVTAYTYFEGEIVAAPAPV